MADDTPAAELTGIDRLRRMASEMPLPQGREGSATDVMGGHDPVRASHGV